MSAWENPYNEPAKYGLEIVADIEWDDEAYQFNQTVIWKDKSGQLYYADDSGCSCPSPFEDYQDSSNLTKATRDEVIAHLLSKSLDSYSYSYGLSTDQKQMRATAAIAKLVQ
jgi:hypothetical protein